MKLIHTRRAVGLHVYRGDDSAADFLVIHIVCGRISLFLYKKVTSRIKSEPFLFAFEKESNFLC